MDDENDRERASLLATGSFAPRLGGVDVPSGFSELTRAGYFDIEVRVSLAAGHATVSYRGEGGRYYSVEVLFQVMTTPDLERILAAVARRQARIDAGGIG